MGLLRLPPYHMLAGSQGAAMGGVDALRALFDAAAATSGYYPVLPGYVFKDTAGTDPCTADGDLIKCFKPQYGSLPNVTQATDSLCPIFKDDGGGLWRADFDGLDDTVASAATLTVNAEEVIAIALTRSATADGILLRVGSSSANYHAISAATTFRLTGGHRTASGTAYSATSANNAFPAASEKVASSLLAAATVDIGNDLGTPVSVAAVLGSFGSAPVQIVPTAALSVHGFSVYRAAAIPAGGRDTIIRALAALQGRTL